eukprot:scaffold315608_cov28-Prasinocladus_malaysianus.AAC.1
MDGTCGCLSSLEEINSQTWLSNDGPTRSRNHAGQPPLVPLASCWQLAAWGSTGEPLAHGSWECNSAPELN